MDRLRTMAIFVAVAEEGGFAAAARRLNTSPPSVTRAISELEARLGARLLHRTTRAVHPTDAGQRYLADCQRILVEIDEADGQASGIHAAPRGTVSLTASAMFGRLILMPMLSDLLNRYPEISLSALFIDRVVHMIDEGIDVAIRIAELPASSLTAIQVGRVRRVLCAAPAYLDRHGYPETLQDLARHTLVDMVNLSPGGEWRFGDGGTDESFAPQSRLRVNSADAAIYAALQGDGITRVLSYMIAPQVASGALRVLLEDFEPAAVPVHVLHKEAGQTSARVRAVVDFLVTRLRREPAIA